MTGSANENKKLLQRNLSALKLNFYTIDEQTRDVHIKVALPDLEEVRNYREKHSAHDPQLTRLLAGDTSMRLYAAILLNEVDKTEALKVLEELATNETEIKVQQSIGHGALSVLVKYPAKAFIRTGDLRKGYIEKAEILNKWKIAILDEAKEKNIPPDIESLPDAAEVIELAETPENSQAAKDTLVKLADNHLIAKRFYAAAALADIDEAASRSILESLLDEETELLILSGDSGIRMPAGRIARDLLSPAMTAPPEFKSQNMLGKFVEWISGLTGGK